MDNAIVTAICVAALGCAAWISIRGRDPAARRLWRHRAVDRSGQVALAVAGASLAFPFVDAVADILS